MPIPSVETSRYLRAAPDRVYQAYVDFSRWLDWVPHFREVTPLGEGLLEPGFKARIALKLSPVKTTWEVTEVVPGRSFAWSCSLPGLRFVFHHMVEGVDGETRATFRAEVRGPLAPLAALGWPVTKATSYMALSALDRMLEREDSAGTEGKG